MVDDRQVCLSNDPSPSPKSPAELEISLMISDVQHIYCTLRILLISISVTVSHITVLSSLFWIFLFHLVVPSWI